MKQEDQIHLMLEYLRGRLDKAAKADFEKRLRTDPELSRLLALVVDLDAEAERINWSEVDPAARSISRRLVDDFYRSMSKGGRKFGVRVYDSGLFPLPEGVRPAAVDTRRLKFRIDEMHLNISIYPASPDSYELIGQLLGYEGSDPLHVKLQCGKKVWSEDSDTFHLFRFARVPIGDCRLRIFDGKTEIGAIDIDL